MKTLSERRYRNIGALLLACAVAFFIYSGAVNALHNPAFISGWVLLALSLFLMFYNVRKKLPFLPLLKSSTWLQLHIYVGLLCGFVFLLHIQFKMPNGMFEVLLASLFSAVFLSGLFGLYISRTFPKKLSRKGENVLYERIPVFRKQTQESIEEIVYNSVEKTGSSTLANFYQEHLADLFRSKYFIWRQLFSSDTYIRGIQEKAAALKPYLNQDELLIIDEILVHVDSKDGLDYQYVHQSILKYWLFLHIPLTYSMLVCMMLHLVTTYAYFGGTF